MRVRTVRTRLEQFRQAKAIHGGVMAMWAAALGVRLARVPIPSHRLRLMLYRSLYGKKYPALVEAECDQPLWAYPSLNALFTRGVRPEYRPISDRADQFLCPCDGRVQDIGRIERDRLLTVKGVEYSIESLLPGVDVRPFCDGHFGIFFLSPSDCHRVFSPQDARVHEVIHVPGCRLLVHPPFQKKEFPVFALNERVVLRLSTPLGACVLVLVAGWGVGNITLRFDRSFRPKAHAVAQRSYADPVPVRRGEWLATFELGSTAILITEALAQTTTNLERDQKVHYGEPAFSISC